jgi:hypothetical protein
MVGELDQSLSKIGEIAIRKCIHSNTFLFLLISNLCQILMYTIVLPSTSHDIALLLTLRSRESEQHARLISRTLRYKIRLRMRESFMGRETA